MQKTLTAVIHREEDFYIAECPEVGTISQGMSLEESIENLKEATELYLEDFPMTETGKTIMTTFDVPDRIESVGLTELEVVGIGGE